jgi:hypothetical protein
MLERRLGGVEEAPEVSLRRVPRLTASGCPGRRDAAAAAARVEAEGCAPGERGILEREEAVAACEERVEAVSVACRAAGRTGTLLPRALPGPCTDTTAVAATAEAAAAGGGSELLRLSQLLKVGVTVAGCVSTAIVPAPGAAAAALPEDSTPACTRCSELPVALPGWALPSPPRSLSAVGDGTLRKVTAAVGT